MRLRASFAVLICGLLLACVGTAQEKSVRPDINKSFKNPDLKKYLKTFEGESREIYTHRKEIVAACQIKPGQAVADIGAGTGLFTRLFAKQVGPKGKVYAVDVAPKFLEHVAKTSAKAGLTNVKTVLCSQTSSELPANSVDVVFVCDTYHHFEFPQRTLASIHQALRPGGRLIVVDFKRIPGVSRAWLLDHVRAGQEVFAREIKDAGFRQIEEVKLPLKENYFLRFEKKALTQTKKTPPNDGRRDAVKDGKKKETKTKGGVAGKLQKIDAGAGKLTLSLEGGKQRSFLVTKDTKFFGPKGGNRGQGKTGLKDDALTVGSTLRIVPAADPMNAAEVHLPVRRKLPEKKK